MIGKKNPNTVTKVLDVDASVQGNLTFKDEVNLHINGNFEGRLETRGELVIGEAAHVKATVHGQRITIAGNVWGDITADEELRIASTGRLTGNVRAPSFAIDKGAVFNGQSRMGDEPAAGTTAGARRVFLSLDEVAGYLSVESTLITQWAETGKLPGGSRDNGSWRFDKQKVDEWIASGRTA